jgi:hypothetical protein
LITIAVQLGYALLKTRIRTLVLLLFTPRLFKSMSAERYFQHVPTQYVLRVFGIADKTASRKPVGVPHAQTV